MESLRIIIYETKNHISPFNKWFENLEANIQRIIAAKLDRVSLGNFGDCEPIRESVYELKIHTGPGYKIYFGKKGNAIVIVLTAGLKRSQKKDIEKPIEYWNLYKEYYG